MLAGVGVRLAPALADLRRFVRDQECQVALIDPDDLVTRTAAGDDVPPTFATAADAIVWCEDWLIERHGGAIRPRTATGSAGRSTWSPTARIRSPCTPTARSNSTNSPATN
jgi:hypothetical protein